MGQRRGPGRPCSAPLCCFPLEAPLLPGSPPEERPKQLDFCLLYDPTCKCCDPCWGHGLVWEPLCWDRAFRPNAMGD